MYIYIYIKINVIIYLFILYQNKRNHILFKYYLR